MASYTRMGRFTSFSCCWILLFTLFSVSNGGGDTLTRSQTIKDGQTLVSPGKSFELGFFSPGGSRNRYLGIWFAVSNETVVWVANRGKPLTDPTGVLTIDGSGNLLLTNTANESIWSSGLSSAGNTVARLLDSGNLVITDASGSDDGVFLWQSFHHPSDTLLASMKLGPHSTPGIDRSLTAWRSPRDPAPGSFVLRLDTRGMPQLLLWEEQRLKYCSGPWNGLRFSGIPEMKSYDMFNFTIVTTQNETYYEFGTTKPNISARLLINTEGVVQRLVLGDRSSWNPFWSAPKDQCDNYAACGPFGVCDINKYPVCNCLPGFLPRNPGEWYMRDGKRGCVRKTKLNCTSGDGFRLVAQVKLPDTVNSTVNMSMSLVECREACSKNCSCTAYSSANISGGDSGCIIWVGKLTDIRAFVSDGQDLYVRLAASEIDSITRELPHGRKATIIILVIVLLGLLLSGLCGFCLWRRRKVKVKVKVMTTREGGARQYYPDTSISREGPDIPLFDVGTIASATNNFSYENMIGKGGFGRVYKGNFNDGQEVAVKRLSLPSVHGIEGFKNEILLIAKLQHRNLVRLLGCCIEGDEWMLIYEYMPNKSLDAFIFDDQRRHLLNWRKRLDIILGVARGLLYLHQDSRLRIIHRDLKPNNILLDVDMNPKISDFGTARIFGGDQIEVTMRAVGTYGYMSPEYAMDGAFSVKSDVFSFGVLALEIISGRKNRWISQTDSSLNLLAHAWMLWKKDRCLELVDDKLSCPCPISEVLRCIQVALLCVQGSPDDRPTMQQVVLMLGNENSTLPQPKHPGFFTIRDPMSIDSSSNGGHSPYSINELTVTTLEGR